MPVWAFHGKLDTVVPFEETERIVRRLDAAEVLCPPIPRPRELCESGASRRRAGQANGARRRTDDLGNASHPPRGKGPGSHPEVARFVESLAASGMWISPEVRRRIFLLGGEDHGG